jgi:hypothetical protein
MVEKVDAGGVTVGGKRIESATVLWTAGVEPSSVVKTLPVPKNRVGRIYVGPKMNIPGYDRLFLGRQDIRGRRRCTAAHCTDAGRSGGLRQTDPQAFMIAHHCHLLLALSGLLKEAVG